MKIRILTLLLLSSVTFGQKMLLTGAGQGSFATAVTPGFVSFNGMPSTETTALGTVVNSNCATRAMCISLVDASVSGDTIIVFYTYKSSGNTARAPTVTDDKGGGSSSYTCVTEANNSTNTYYVGLCYVINAAAGILKITVTWPAGCGTTLCTQASAAAMLAYNIASFDTSAGNSGTSTTTFTSGSATSTAGSDYWVQLACASGTPLNTGAWTVGSQGGITWVLDHADRRDGCAIQHGVQTAAGALNPQMTIGSADAFVSIGGAFKSGTSGTAPSGFYISRIYHYNSATSGTGPYSVQLPVTGNLVVATAMGGGAGPQKLTGVSDGTNTYTACAEATVANGTSQFAQAYYAANVTPATLAITLTTTGTGDLGPAVLYDIVGAATTQTCPNQRYDSGAGVTAASLSIASLSAITSSDGNNGGMDGLYRPGADSSITIGHVNWGQNTATAITSPSGAVFDLVTFGGEPIDGPTSVDQNGGGAHYKSAANTQQTWTFTLSNNARATASINGGLYSFQGSGATLASVIVTYQTQLQSIANSVTISVPLRSSLSTESIIVAIGAGTSHTVTRVSADAVCTNADFTQATSAASTNGTQRADIWYLLNTSGKTNLCVTYSGSAGTFNKEVKVWYVKGITAFDTGAHTNAGASSGNVSTGAAVTTTGSTGFIASIITVSDSITLSPDTGNEFKDGGVIWQTTNDAASSFVSSSAATHTPTFHNSASTGAFGSSTAAFK